MTVSAERLTTGAIRSWINVVIGALLMLATLPGRTQGLGLITEPMLKDLRLDRVTYADINLWATLLGGAFCLPAGWLLDRYNRRWTTTLILLLLGVVVWRISVLTGGVAALFILILLTRALGQSALSVASITVVGKSFGKRVGLAMSVYSILISLGFATAFKLVGGEVRAQGWRGAWREVAFALVVVVAPLTLLLLSSHSSETARDSDSRNAADSSGVKLSDALRSPVFWIFAGAASLYGLVSSGLGLFNEAVLAERGFDQKTYHTLLSVTTLIALVGQMFSGWLTLRWPMRRLLAAALFIYAAGLLSLPMLRTHAQLWAFAGLVGVSGGIITVVFFAIWRQAFGALYLARIQGAAQMLTVLASALGPLLFAKCHALTGSYFPILLGLAPAVALVGVAAWRGAATAAFPEAASGAVSLEQAR